MFKFSFFCRFFARLNHDDLLKPAVKRSCRIVPPKIIKLVNEIVLKEGPSAVITIKVCGGECGLFPAC